MRGVKMFLFWIPFGIRGTCQICCDLKDGRSTRMTKEPRQLIEGGLSHFSAEGGLPSAPYVINF